MGRISNLGSIFLLATTGSLPLAAQGASVDLAPRWQVGERFRLERIVEREDQRRGRTVQRSRARCDIDVEVLRRQGDGYAIAWRYGPIELIEPRNAPPALKQITSIGSDLVLEFRTDAKGQPVELLNREAVRTLYDRAMTELRKAMESMGSPAGGTDRALQQMLGGMGIDALVETALQDPRSFHAALGVRLERGKTLRSTDSLPNPFGGSLPCQQEIQLLNHPEASRARVRWSQTVDEDAAKKASVAAVRYLMGGRSVPDPDRIPPMDLRSEAFLTIDLRSNWPVESEITRTTDVAGSKRTERFTFRRADQR